MKSSHRNLGLRHSAEPLHDQTRSPRARLGRSRAGREDGAAAVEFAIVASLFFLLVFGIIDFGFAFHSWNNTANAAREGARKGAVDNDVALVEARARAAAVTLDQTKLTVSVVCSPDGVAFAASSCGTALEEGDIVRVVVDYDYDLITPLGSFVPGIGPTMDLHSQSESRFEG